MSDGEPTRLGFDEESPFFDDIPDPKVRERAKFHAQEHYEHSKSFRQLSYQATSDWGKWLIASLLAIHGGSIYTLTNVYAQTDSKDIIVQAIGLNVAGVVATMMCGFWTWVNFQHLMSSYDFYSNPARTYRRDYYLATPASQRDPVRATYWLSVASGFFSMFFFVASACLVVQSVKFADSRTVAPIEKEVLVPPLKSTR